MVEAAVDPQKQSPRYYWLCNECRRKMTVVAEKDGNIKVADVRSAKAA